MNIVTAIRTVTVIAIAVVVTSSALLPAAAVAAGCATSIAPAPAGAATLIAGEYANWKQAYVVDAGNSQLRVQRSAGDNYDTVSEGIAYGMLFAVYGNDKTTFDGLWKYAKAHVNQNGLMNWRIAADGSTTGYNGATDADEDMAAALIAADKQWSGYRADAVKLIGLIKQHQVEPGTNILKPGDAWGGSDLLNPSYITPSYYGVFAEYTGDSAWNAIKIANDRVLQAISTNTVSRTTGYIPDWSKADGSRASGMGYEYGYDGSRAPLRLAMASSWDCDDNATSMLTKLNTTNQKLDLTNLASSYDLNGDVNSRGDGTPLLAAAATAAMVSDNAAYRAETWSALVANNERGYFSDAMRMFGMYVASGVLVNPLSLTPKAPVATVPPTTPPAAPRTFSMTSNAVTAEAGTPFKITVAVAAPRATQNTIVDLELFNSTGTRVKQTFYEQQNIGTTPSTYIIEYTPAASSSFTLKGGLFTSGWASNLLWNGDITSATAIAPAPTTPPVVVAPTPPTPPVVVVPTPVPTPAPELPMPTPAPVPTPPVVVVSVITPTLSNVSIWWPSNGSNVRGIQPFKAVLDGKNLADYTMYWQVDGGALNRMNDDLTDAPHKEVLVDVSGWKWQPSNKYTINFVTKDATGAVIAQKSTQIIVNN